MRSEFLPLSKPSISEIDINAVGEVLRSGWITTGPKVAEFEKKFSEFIGCSGAVALSSATAGMHLALKAFGIGPGDEVITPSLTWISTVNMIVLSGATPVFVDVDRDTLMLKSKYIEKGLTDKTKLIIPVNFGGASADVDSIKKLANSRNIPLIWDNAHAIGTRYKGKHVGYDGTSIFSFHPIKNMTTGEGGMFCSDDSTMIDQVRRLKFHGLGKDAYDREMQGRTPQVQVIEPGYKYNMSDISAVLGIHQLDQVNYFNRRRNELAKKYLDKLSEIDEILPLSIPTYRMEHAWNLFIVRLITKSNLNRDQFMSKLKESNIGTGIHFQPVHQQKFYKELLKENKINMPNTEWNGDRICSLPLFPAMKEDDVDDVVDTIKKVLK